MHIAVSSQASENYRALAKDPVIREMAAELKLFIKYGEFNYESIDSWAFMSDSNAEYARRNGKTPTLMLGSVVEALKIVLAEGE